MADTIPRLVTLPEAAAALRLSPHTIRAMVRRGRLRPVRILMVLSGLKRQVA